MVKLKFKMHPNMILDILGRQSGGESEKGILEAIQNSWDARATIINIEILTDRMTIIDNGIGMDYDTIINKYIVFGNSHKRLEDNNIGEFGIGKGQYLILGKTTIYTGNYKTVINTKKFMGAEIKKRKNKIKGTKIVVKFYKILSINEENFIRENIEKNVIPVNRCAIIINDKKHEYKIKVIEENDNFVAFTTRSYQNRIYSQNLFVKDFTSNFRFNVNCKNKMKLNFARNRFMENDVKTKELYKFMDKIEAKLIAEIMYFNQTEADNILRRIKDGRLDIVLMMEKNVVRLADNSMVSLYTLIKRSKDSNWKPIIVGKADRDSGRAIIQGYTVVEFYTEWKLSDIISRYNLPISISSLKVQDVVSAFYHKDKINLEKIKKNYGKKAVTYCLYIKELYRSVFVNKYLHKNRELFIGKSDSAEGWTDGVTEVHLNINSILSNNWTKAGLTTWVFHVICHELAHDEPDTEKVSHDMEFYKRYHDLVDKAIKKLGSFMNKQSYADIKRKWKGVYF